MVKRIKTKSAFTLAEVLIALVIIGVIAALTISTAINKMQREELRSQFKKAFGVISQTVQKMKVDYGNIIFNSTQDSASDFRNKFMKYFSVVCKDNCMDNSKYKNHANKNNDPEMQGHLRNCFTVHDGMIFCFSKGATSGTIYIDVDINGDKNPNRWGYDVFTFYISNENQSLMPSSDGVPYFAFVCNNTASDFNGPSCSVKAISDTNYFKKLP